MAQVFIHTVFKRGRLISAFNPTITNALFTTKVTNKTETRNFSSEVKKNTVHTDESKISKSVFISQSDDIFTNLALEDWLYKNFDFTNHHVMLLWRNSPSVVIGRHQNPWLEANFGPLSEQGVQIARRNSGGGAVYHDHGNLNLTFFTPRDRYNRKKNLEIITSALHREWGLKTEVNKKEDIVIDGMNKISGTASKLGRPNSYHHCTLLVDVNKNNLSESLHKYEKGIETNATVSIPSPVRNLAELDSTINVQRLISAVGWEYLRTTPLTQEDGGWGLVARQRGFQMINPTDEWFPGLEKIRTEFQSWDWKFGRTPKFHITRSFLLPQSIVMAGSRGEVQQEELRVTVTVTKGLVEDVIMRIPPSLMMSDQFVEDIKVMANIRGRRFTEDALDELNASFGASHSLRDDGKQFVADCMRKVMASV
uniref:BPL/LPL catalytic domain-containing protein n=1 Tax=Graphocephala atropunctata TaxID=36148 RepID=A0A1B6KYI1_9HEMI